MNQFIIRQKFKFKLKIIFKCKRKETENNFFKTKKKPLFTLAHLTKKKKKPNFYSLVHSVDSIVTRLKPTCLKLCLNYMSTIFLLFENTKNVRLFIYVVSHQLLFSNLLEICYNECSIDASTTVHTPLQTHTYSHNIQDKMVSIISFFHLWWRKNIFIFSGFKCVLVGMRMMMVSRTCAFLRG